MFGKLFGNTKEVTREEYQQIFAETGIDLDDRMTHFNAKGKTMEEEISQYVNFTKIIPGFKSLHPKDVSNLLKGNINRIHLCFLCPRFWRNYIRYYSYERSICPWAL